MKQCIFICSLLVTDDRTKPKAVFDPTRSEAADCSTVSVSRGSGRCDDQRQWT